MSGFLCIPVSRCIRCECDFFGLGTGFCHPCEAYVANFTTQERIDVLRRKGARGALLATWARIWREQLRQERAARAEA